MNRKYVLTDISKQLNGHTLYRIQSVIDFRNINAGEYGGWVESEANLSQCDDCWIENEAAVYGNAAVYNHARVADSAQVYDNAIIAGNAIVCGSARVCESATVSWNAFVLDAEVKGSATITNNARIKDSATVEGNALVGGYACVCDNAWITGDACITENAYVHGDSVIVDHAKVYGNAEVNNNPICRVGGFSKVHGWAKIVSSDIYGKADIEGHVEVLNRVVGGTTHLQDDEDPEFVTQLQNLLANVSPATLS